MGARAGPHGQPHHRRGARQIEGIRQHAAHVGRVLAQQDVLVEIGDEQGPEVGGMFRDRLEEVAVLPEQGLEAGTRTRS